MHIGAGVHTHTYIKTPHIYKSTGSTGGYGLPGPLWGSDGFLFASLFLVKMLKTGQTRAVLIQQNCC